MNVTVGDIIKIMEQEIAPPGTAEPWDKVGLCVGDRTWPVDRVWVALDPLEEVLDAACADGAGMLITHHPLLLRGIHQVDLGTCTGRVIARAITGRVALFAAHTNLDKAPGGTTDLLVRGIGLSDITPLAAPPEAPYLACTGSLKAPTSLCQLARDVKALLGGPEVRAVGSPGLAVRRVGVCAGSGSSLLGEFLASEADAFITGDIRYHDARMVAGEGKGLIDIGHFASEHPVVESLAERLRKCFEIHGMDSEVIPCRLEKDPFLRI